MRFRVRESKRVQVKLVSISPVTSAVIHELGLPVAAEASEYTSAGVIEVLIALAGLSQKGDWLRPTVKKPNVM